MERSTDREKVIKGLEICVDRIPGKYTCNECPYEVDGNYCEINLTKDAITLLKEQDNETKRIMKVIWETLHEGLSIDTVPDQDWVYELIRHRIEDS